MAHFSTDLWASGLFIKTLLLYAYCSAGVWHGSNSNLKLQSQKPFSCYYFSYSCLIPHRPSLSRSPGNLLFHFQRVTAQMATSSVMLFKPNPAWSPSVCVYEVFEWQSLQFSNRHKYRRDIKNFSYFSVYFNSETLKIKFLNIIWVDNSFQIII